MIYHDRFLPLPRSLLKAQQHPLILRAFEVRSSKAAVHSEFCAAGTDRTYHSPDDGARLSTSIALGFLWSKATPGFESQAFFNRLYSSLLYLRLYSLRSPTIQQHESPL